MPVDPDGTRSLAVGFSIGVDMESQLRARPFTTAIETTPGASSLAPKGFDFARSSL